MNEGKPKTPVGLARQSLRIVLMLAVVAGLGALAVWDFIAGRGEAALEAQRERPIQAPLRVSQNAEGAPVVTLDAETRERVGVVIARPKPTQYQEQVCAYGTVLDLDKLVTLENS